MSNEELIMYHLILAAGGDVKSQEILSNIAGYRVTTYEAATIVYNCGLDTREKASYMLANLRQKLEKNTGSRRSRGSVIGNILGEIGKSVWEDVMNRIKYGNG